MSCIFSCKKIPLPQKLIKFGKVFTDAGFEAYLVGGAVRDYFMKKDAHDWDVATNATPEQVMKLFKFCSTNRNCSWHSYSSL